jgi:glycyl-tRNA synthetase beta chain
MPEATSLAAANKRIGNILKKAEDALTYSVSTDLLVEKAEKAFWLKLCEVEVEAQGCYATGNYTAVLQTLALLREPADTFFNDVMVNVEDEAIKNNRLAILSTANQLFSLVADIGQL